jgi:two-component sensor histidine kinase
MGRSGHQIRAAEQDPASVSARANLDRRATLLLGCLHCRNPAICADEAFSRSCGAAFCYCKNLALISAKRRMAHARSAIDGRFAALARAHDLLTRASWENATIDSTVRSAVEPFDQGAGRFVIWGEDIRITSSSVIAFAMTLNELCTNTTKFGALSLPSGQVRLSWHVEDARLRLEWAEFGGPRVSEPTRKSFGTRMITSLGQQLKGQVELDYKPSGFVYRLNVPVEALTTK